MLLLQFKAIVDTGGQKWHMGTVGDNNSSTCQYTMLLILCGDDAFISKMMMVMMKTQMKETVEPKVRLKKAKRANQASDLTNHAPVQENKKESETGPENHALLYWINHPL